jgi:hypothetical protein
MFPASTKGGGILFGFPDVCKVPAPPAPFIPTPFPNTSQGTDIKGSTACTKVKILNKVSAVVGTETTRSMGDEPGTLKGMVAPFQMDGAVYKLGSVKVKFGGKKAAVLTSMTGMNHTSNSNAPPGLQVDPSQTKVDIML